MNKEMIISSNGHETRVAILEDDQLAEIFVERERNRGVVGNVYKGRVSKVLPGMQSSFIDLGLERDGFLYVSDVISNLDEFDGVDDDLEPKAQAVDGAEKERGEKDRERSRDKGQPEAKIEDLLKEGQDVVVQVAKEPLGTKGARLTCHVTLPGRFLVFMPTVDHIGISRKIATREERTRLRGIVKEFRDQHHFGGGVIIRTAAENRTKEDILADLHYFHKIWVEMRQKSEGRRSPAVIYQEPSLVNKLLRDLLTDDYSAIRIDDPKEHERILEFIGRIMPTLSSRVKLYRQGLPDLRGVRGPGRTRQGAPQQGLAEVGRVDRHQPDRGAGRDRRQHRALCRQEDRRPPGGHHHQDEPGGGQGDRPPDPAARPRRHHRLRLHRHGGEEEPPEGVRRRWSRNCARTGRRRRPCRSPTSASSS